MATCFTRSLHPAICSHENQKSTALAGASCVDWSLTSADSHWQSVAIGVPVREEFPREICGRMELQIALERWAGLAQGMSPSKREAEESAAMASDNSYDEYAPVKCNVPTSLVLWVIFGRTLATKPLVGDPKRWWL